MVYPMLVSDLMKALSDEQGAMAFYGKLADMAPSNWERMIILGIKRDETAHAITLARWLTRMTGHLHLVEQLPEPNISSFKEGVADAINDEREAYENYGRIADQVICLNLELYYDLKNIQKDEKYHRELLEMIR